MASKKVLTDVGAHVVTELEGAHCTADKPVEPNKQQPLKKGKKKAGKKKTSKKAPKSSSETTKEILGIKSEAEANETAIEAGWWQISLESLDGSAIKLFVSAEERPTVLHLKAKYSQVDGSSPDTLHFLEPGNDAELKNSTRIGTEESSIQDGSTLSVLKDEPKPAKKPWAEMSKKQQRAAVLEEYKRAATAAEMTEGEEDIPWRFAAKVKEPRSNWKGEWTMAIGYNGLVKVTHKTDRRTVAWTADLIPHHGMKFMAEASFTPVNPRQKDPADFAEVCMLRFENGGVTFDERDGMHLEAVDPLFFACCSRRFTACEPLPSKLEDLLELTEW